MSYRDLGGIILGDRAKLMREENVFKLFLRFSIPAILGMIVQSLYNIVDRIFIGNIPGTGGLAISGVGAHNIHHHGIRHAFRYRVRCQHFHQARAEQER